VDFCATIAADAVMMQTLQTKKQTDNLRWKE